ncbi:MAG: cyclophane-forming radical SAM/SPASM peptide maturase YhhB [Bacteroidia bacterium]
MVDNNSSPSKIVFSAVLLKVASRCNLNCDYCYVYNHIDQSWRTQPHFMSGETLEKISHRIGEYVKATNQDEFSIIFHGGEPLLYGEERLVEAVNLLNKNIPASCKVDYSLQTNGTLLTKSYLEKLEELNISISISLDGPKEINDLHRVDHKGRSSFQETIKALELLKEAKPNIFQGVIAVIDPSIPPKKYLDYFYHLNIPKLDLLLPDATHQSPPMGRNEEEHLYSKWLNEVFTIWFQEFSDLSIRIFDSILASRFGVPSPTDAIGFGAVSLIVIETDGSYSDHDVFKIIKEGGGVLDHDVYEVSLEEISLDKSFQEHSLRLNINGIAKECKFCPIVESCGGGSIMHRYHQERSLDAPTIYCQEMYSLFNVSTKLIKEALTQKTLGSGDEVKPILIPFKDSLIEKAVKWNNETKLRALELNKSHFEEIYDRSPASTILQYLSPEKEKTDRRSDKISHHSIWFKSIKIQNSDPWLINPFSDTIEVLPITSKEFTYAISQLESIQEIISILSPDLLISLKSLVSDILFVKDISQSAGGIFSFSDDRAPNVIYLSAYEGGKPIPPEDLTDSILHEFFHHVLYHMEKEEPLLYDYEFPRFPAPWRKGLRPSGGFLHGTFVFSGLASFWQSLYESDFKNVDKGKAEMNAKKFHSQAQYGIRALHHFGLLTPRGEILIKNLAYHLKADLSLPRAPGILERSIL